MREFFFEHIISVTTAILTLIFVSAILRAKKPAGNTMAWLLTILIAPYAGAPLYLIFGGRKLPTKLAHKRNLYQPGSQPETPPGTDGLQRILRASGIPQPRQNVSIKLLPTGHEAFECYLAQIQAAKKSIYITTFILGNDSVGKTLLKALSDKAAQGVDVRLIVDSMGAIMIRLPSLKNFRRAGGLIAYFMPVLHLPFRGRTNLRNHRKLLVTDGEFATLGGMNLAEEYMGPDESDDRWADLALQIEGQSVHDLERIFLKDWAFASRHSDVTQEESKHETPAGGPLAQVVGSGPDVLGDPLYDLLLSSIFSATREIKIVTPYFIPDESLTKALELAAKRGVRVDVLLPRRSNHFLADIARGSFIRQLMHAGVRFHFYEQMIHAKVVLVDQTTGLLGSANFDMRSLLVNYELGVLIYDKPFLDQVSYWIESCYAKTSPEFTRETFGRQILEGMGRVVGPLI